MIGRSIPVIRQFEVVVRCDSTDSSSGDVVEFDVVQCCGGAGGCDPRVYLQDVSIGWVRGGFEVVDGVC